MRNRLRLLPLALSSIALLSPALASANVYEATICGPGAHADGLTRQNEGSFRIFTSFCRPTEAGEEIEQFAVESSEERGPIRGSQRWTLTAPANTKILLASMITRFNDGDSWNGVAWQMLAPDRGNEVLEEQSEDTLPGGVLERGRVYQVNSTRLSGRMFCPIAQCALPTAIVRLKEVSVLIEDTTAPVIEADFLPIAKGVEEVTFRASDRGAGVATAALFVDGELATETNVGDGDCAQPYKLMAPCEPSVESSLTFNTRSLSEGEHKVEVLVNDGARNFTSSAPETVIVDNLPDPKEPARPTSPTPPTPRPPLAGDKTAPSLTKVSLTHTRFRIGKGAAAIAARAKRSPAGSVLRFTSDDAGKLLVQIQTAGGKTIGTIARRIQGPGPGSLALSGRVGRKRLKPGRYRMLVSARDAAGNASQPQRLAFTILP